MLLHFVLQTELVVRVPVKSSPVLPVYLGNKMRATDKDTMTGRPRRSGAPDSGLYIMRKALFTQLLRCVLGSIEQWVWVI